jgi:hypothetical protein
MAQERVLNREASASRAKRPDRSDIPVNGRRNVLSVRGKEPGFEYRVVTDRPGRVEELQDLGYEVVTHKAVVGDKRVATPAPEGSPVKIALGKGEQGYLMRQRKEWYDEDQRRKQEEVDASEKAMLRTHRQGAQYGEISVFNGNEPRSTE